MVELKPVQRDDIVPLMQMGVADNQQDFIVHNAMTIAQAAFEPDALIFGIWTKEALVGLTAVVDMRNYPYIGQGLDPVSGYVWRFMIDVAHQRKGYGRAAMFRIEDWAREAGLLRLYVASAQGNVSALKLYRSVGYRPTGRVAAGEMELCKPVRQKRSAQKRA